MFHPQTGQPMEEKEYREQLDTWMPNAADKKAADGHHRLGEEVDCAAPAAEIRWSRLAK